MPVQFQYSTSAYINIIMQKIAIVAIKSDNNNDLPINPFYDILPSLRQQ